MKSQKDNTMIPDIEDYNVVVGYQLDDVSDAQIVELNESLTSKFRATKEQMNQTADITCQSVWLLDTEENSILHATGFDSLLLIGFNGFGTAESPENPPQMNEYSVPVVILEGTLENIESKIGELLDIEDIKNVERVILAPREHGSLF